MHIRPHKIKVFNIHNEDNYPEDPELSDDVVVYQEEVKQ